MYTKNYHSTTPILLHPPILLGLPWVTLESVPQVGREWEDAGELNWEYGLRPEPPYRAQPSCPTICGHFTALGGDAIPGF